MTSEFAIAVHALMFLEHKGIVISSEELAKNVCTQPGSDPEGDGKIEKG